MRTFLCLISLIAVFNSYAQNINTNFPYIWEEIEVIDTVKAEEMANKIKSDKKADISKSNEKISTQITLLTMLKDKKQKKVQNEQEITLLQEIATEHKGEIVDVIDYNLNLQRLRNGRTPRTNSDRMIENIMSNLTKGKINDYYFISFDRIITKLQEELQDEKQYENMCFTSLVSPLPMKTIKVKKDNPNYLDPDFHWLDRYNTDKLILKSTSFPVKEEYYASEEYPQFKFYKDNYMSHRWLIYDLFGNFVAASMPTEYDLNYHGVDWQMIDACSLYDFEHNTYNINQESEAVRNYIAYTLKNGHSLRSEISSIELGQSMIDKILQESKRMLVAGRMTQEQYNKNYAEHKRLTMENQKRLTTLRKQIPSKDVIERADNYVEQLKKDNEDRLPRSNRDFKISRIDGLNFILTSDSGLKLQQTGYYNSKENRVEWSYKVLEK